jgi:hypothetical protein
MSKLRNFACSTGSSVEGSRRYHFELSRYEGGEWIPVRVDPLPPAGCSISHVVPDAMVKRIFMKPLDLKRQYSMRMKVIHGLKVLCYDVRYVLLSNSHLFGIVWVFDPPESSARPKDQSMVITRVDCRYEEKSEETNYGELLEYMQRYPEVQEHIFEYFFLKLKPKMDKRLERELTRS